MSRGSLFLYCLIEHKAFRPFALSKTFYSNIIEMLTLATLRKYIPRG